VAALSRRRVPPDGAGGRLEAGTRRVTSVLCAPLIGRSTHGVIYCDRVDRPERYERADLHYLCSVAAQVAVAIENIRAHEDVAALARNLEPEVEVQYDLVGQSPSLKRVFEFIRKAAPTDAGVLICGESGTGKELVARAIHYNSNRSKGTFEAVSCAAMSQTLIESELFGHVKGAFTGAITDRPGRFELADKGTIFLDEIGALPVDCQTKLLRVLEMGTVRRVGDVKDRTVDVRVIAATNEDLDGARREGRFREDLFYRLNVLRTDLPPLCERGDDIELLALHFLAHFNEKCGRPIRGFDSGVLDVFRRYRWPGNVRELKNVVERMVIMCEGDVLRPELLPAEMRQPQARRAADLASEQAQELQPLEELEKRYVLEVLRRTEGNKKKAADILGVDRSTLYAKLKRYQGE
jgi:DNA-binding NtrC family response regulator